MKKLICLAAVLIFVLCGCAEKTVEKIEKSMELYYMDPYKNDGEIDYRENIVGDKAVAIIGGNAYINLGYVDYIKNFSLDGDKISVIRYYLQKEKEEYSAELNYLNEYEDGKIRVKTYGGQKYIRVSDLIAAMPFIIFEDGKLYVYRGIEGEKTPSYTKKDDENEVIKIGEERYINAKILCGKLDFELRENSIYAKQVLEVYRYEAEHEIELNDSEKHIDGKIRVQNVDETLFVNENDFFENFRFIKIIDGVIYKNYIPEMEGYGDYLDDYCIPLEFGLPEYTVEEIKEMRYYSVEELKTALSTVADVVQYIVETDFADNNRNADILFNLGGYKWQTGESPEICLKHQVSGCAGMSNLFRYILEDDYDEEGYMGYGNRNLKNGSGGGHVFNYFKKDGMILTFDFTGCRYDSFGVDNFQYVSNEFSEMAPFFEEINEMQKEMDTGAVYFLFFAEKDVHRDSAPRAGAAPSGKLTMSLSSQYKDEIEVIYFDESFVKEYYDFESLFIDVEIPEERIASEIERAYQNVEVPDRSYSPAKITLKINDFEINTFSGFYVSGNPLVAYVLADGVPVSDYEVSFNGDIGTIEKQEDGSLLLNAKKKGEQEFYITYKGEKVYFNWGVDENNLQ